MTKDQRMMLFGLFQSAMEKRGISGKEERDAERSRITESLFGKLISWSEFTEHHIDRMKRHLMVIVDGADLDSAIEVVRYEERDRAVAAHIPVPRPGKRQYSLRGGPRRHASIYEKIAPADDPGERRRLIWFVSHLFDESYIRRFACDIDGVTEWRDLPLPQLAALRDVLANRLSSWLTHAKQQPHAEQLIGVNIASSNPRSPTGIASNKDLIHRLLDRGKPVSLISRKQLKDRRHAVIEPALFEAEQPF
jgi:hypothetical protein